MAVAVAPTMGDGFVSAFASSVAAAAAIALLPLCTETGPLLSSNNAATELASGVCFSEAAIKVEKMYSKRNSKNYIAGRMTSHPAADLPRPVQVVWPPPVPRSHSAPRICASATIMDLFDWVKRRERKVSFVYVFLQR